MNFHIDKSGLCDIGNLHFSFRNIVVQRGGEIEFRDVNLQDKGSSKLTFFQCNGEFVAQVDNKEKTVTYFLTVA